MKNSKTKKILSILLAVMMVVGMIPATAIPVSAASVNTSTIQREYGVNDNHEIIIDGEESIELVEPDAEGDRSVRGMFFEKDVVIKGSGKLTIDIFLTSDYDLPAGIFGIYSMKSITISESVQVVVNIENYSQTADVRAIYAGGGIFVKDSASLDIDIYSQNTSNPVYGISTYAGEILLDGSGEKNININSFFGGACISNIAHNPDYEFENNGDITITGTGKVVNTITRYGCAIQSLANGYNTDGMIYIDAPLEISGSSEYAIQNQSTQRAADVADIMVSNTTLTIADADYGIGSRANGIRLHNSDVTITTMSNAINTIFPFTPFAENTSNYGLDVTGGGTVVLKSTDYNAIKAKYDTSGRTGSVLDVNLLANGSLTIENGTAVYNETIGFAKVYDTTSLLIGTIDENTRHKDVYGAYLLTPATNKVKFVSTAEEFCVEYDANGGTGEMEILQGVNGEYTLLDCDFTHPDEDFYFKAWNVNGKEMLPGAVINVEDNITAFAVWTNRPYVISSTVNGVTCNNGGYVDIPYGTADIIEISVTWRFPETGNQLKEVRGYTYERRMNSDGAYYTNRGEGAINIIDNGDNTYTVTETTDVAGYINQEFGFELQIDYWASGNPTTFTYSAYAKVAEILIDEVNVTVQIPDDWNDSDLPGHMQTEGMEILSDKWFILEDGVRTEMENDESFVANQEYVYQMVIAPEYGYERLVAPESGVYINGEPAKFISRTDNRGIIYEKNFVARAKLYPLVNKDTYFMQKGDSLQIDVSAFGSDVQYSWEAITANAPEFTGGTTKRIIITSKPEDEGAYQYKCTFTDKYGETATRTITVYVADMGFRDISPLPSAEDIETGISDHGYMSYGAVLFFAHDLPQEMLDAGYTMETSVTDYMDGEIVGTGVVGKIYDPTIYGEHEIVQKIIIKDDKGDVFKEYTHTHKLNLTRRVQAKVFAYGNSIDDATIRVTQNGKYVYETSTTAVLGNHNYAFYIPVDTFEIEIQKKGYKSRIYEFTLDGDDEFTLNGEMLRWGDANLDDVIDVLDYQQTINKGLSDNHQLDGSYEQSVMDWCEDGYIDVLDCFYSILCINGNALYSASLEYDEYYTIEGATLSIPVKAEGFGLKYQWTAPEGAPQIVEGTENKDTVQIDVALNKGYLGNTYTYTCKVNDRFFNESILTVDVTVEELGNLYAVTYSSQYDEIADQLPGKVYVKKGESITISDTVPEMDGYTFLYWRTGDLQRFSPGDTYKPYQNTVISPYMGKNYTITLHSGYEGELFGTHTGCYGHHYDLPDMDYMPEGYVFYGWTDVEGSTEVKYTKGATYEIKGDADLYPVIAKASDVNLTIYANDGTDTVIYTQTLADEGASSFTIPEDLEMPTRDGYVCRYFYIDPNYVHGDYHEERLLYPGSEIIAGAEGINLYVIWIPEYSVTYDSGTDDENVYVPYPETYGYGDYARVSTDKPYREGYNFLYWEDANGTKYYGNEVIIVESAIVLTAVWEKIDTENYEIWIAGQKVSRANPVVQCGTGTARVVEDEFGYCTIILDGAQITGTEGIRTEYNSIDIEVYGENTITVSGDDARGIIGSNGNISITGPGSLTINATGDGARGIYGLHGVDYTNITVNAIPETEDGVTFGITSSSDLWINNGAVLTVTGTCGFAIHGIYADSTSRIYATGTRYGFYDISSFMGFGGRIVAKGGISAISTTNSYFESWHPSGMVTSYSTSIDGSNLAVWDGSEKFYDDDYSTSGVKYVEIHPVLCTDGHSPSTFEGLDTGCESDGLTDGEYCSVCGYIITEREYVEATGHDYHTHNGKEPTCTEQGVDGTYTQCDKCGEYQGDVTFIDATGHSWGEWILIDGTDIWYDEYGYGEREYIRYCYNCDEYERIWYSYEDPNDTGSPNDWESGGAGPGKS